jgi:diacylglycerol O-acyltransferase
MQRLSGTDAGFLYGETAAWHMHAGVVVMLDPSTASGGFGLDALRDVIRKRLPELGLFRYRVSSGPFGIGGSYWVEVPELDLEAHVKAATLPAPAGMRELATFTADVFSRKLDRRRPLWEMWLVEPVEGDLAALVVKVHHACVDGVRGVQLYDVLFDLAPDAPHERGVGLVHPPESEPSPATLLCATASELLSTPVRVGRAMRAVAGAGIGVAAFTRSPERRYATFPFEARRSRFDGALTPSRSVAFSSLPIDEVRAARVANGVTFNDVVLAACTGALRRSLLAHGVTPRRPLIAQVPVGVHRNVSRAEAAAVPGNFLSAIGAVLPVHLADPQAQLRAVSDSTRAAKALHHALGENFLIDLVDAAPAALISATVNAYAALHLDRLHPPIFNVLVSNVPGPPVPVYSAGAKLVATYPLGPLLVGCGLNITVFSYVDHVNVGLVACPDLVDDVEVIAQALPTALHDLIGGTSPLP